MTRTALLVRCTTEEADRIRVEAAKQRRTISSYVLFVMIRALQAEDRLFLRLSRYTAMNQVLSRRSLIGTGPRTAILVRCEAGEAERIREAARRRDMPINGFVLHALKRVWSVQAEPRPISAIAEVPPAAGAAD